MKIVTTLIGIFIFNVCFCQGMAKRYPRKITYHQFGDKVRVKGFCTEYGERRFGFQYKHMGLSPNKSRHLRSSVKNSLNDVWQVVRFGFRWRKRYEKCVTECLEDH